MGTLEGIVIGGVAFLASAFFASRFGAFLADNERRAREQAAEMIRRGKMARRADTLKKHANTGKKNPRTRAK